DGFERFGAALARARATAPAGEIFERACLAYLAFGEANRGVYRLMFASRLLITSQDVGLERASGASFDFLQQGVAYYVPAEQVYPAAVWVWSTLHGLVMLEVEGLVSGPHEGKATSAQVVRQMVATFARTSVDSPAS
ncbi:MAG: TetR-like C-terminal domain-containing protein, partial [Caulobacteraceae bacterium]